MNEDDEAMLWAFTILCVLGAILIALFGCAERSAFSNRLIKVQTYQEAMDNCTPKQ